ncbi:hypothetical protein F3Y22_tig00110429pilonHSYRG01501 [Hibiscus syriacus]|uniref:Uncharacterized protein n=1 Tax=Hibiscus syriacus TaxID=106335 RepID=A0A6A3ANB5_HIBSY|nr:hypothetical protein F3Y22_tig00110429pilonHSYRG01501 [Hibiscus syriacus]
MRARLTPEPSLSLSSIQINSRNHNPSRIPTSLRFLNENGGRRFIGRKSRLIATRAVLDSAAVEQLGLNESETRRFLQRIETLSCRSRSRLCWKLKLGFALDPLRPDRSLRNRRLRFWTPF